MTSNELPISENPDTYQAMVGQLSEKPNIIGLYGVSGCGKTTMLNRLKERFGEECFIYFDGSAVIRKQVKDGNIDSFHAMSDVDQAEVRSKAIRSVQQHCKDNGKIGIVTGHFVFWDETTSQPGEPIWTEADADSYTHIIYMNTSPDHVHSRIAHDKKRVRKQLPVKFIKFWQEYEKGFLEKINEHRKHNLIKSYQTDYLKLDSFKEIMDIVIKAAIPKESINLQRASDKLDEVVSIMHSKGHPETIVVLDADKTLANIDTGNLFWIKAAEYFKVAIGDKFPLKELFKDKGYNLESFWEAMALYERETDDDTFEKICNHILGELEIYPQFIDLLDQIRTKDHVGAVVITCGIRRVWEMALKRAGLDDIVKVIGGGRFSDAYVVNNKVKAGLVSHLQDVHHMYVWAFGDSPLDLDMMKKADQAIVVVCSEDLRSKSMEGELFEAIKGGLHARQMMTSSGPIRLDKNRLPVIELNNDFIKSIFGFRSKRQDRVYQATDTNIARLLMTQTRDASINGPVLRQAHELIGWYLTSQFLSQIVGVEEFPTPHVQSNTTSGYRVFQEKRILVVALMRAGEPVALGVSSALPLSAFLHAKNAGDVNYKYLTGRRTIVLADGVINDGHTVVEFIEHIRKINSSVRIVIITAVTQSKALKEGRLAELFEQDTMLSLVTLRMSDNKYTGRGGTDTGHRLFNTIFLD